MSSGVVFDGVFVSLDIDPTVGVVFALFAGAVKSVAFDCSTTRALFDVNAFGGHIGSDVIVDDLIAVTLVLFAVGPVVELLQQELIPYLLPFNGYRLTAWPM